MPPKMPPIIYTLIQFVNELVVSNIQIKKVLIKLKYGEFNNLLS